MNEQQLQVEAEQLKIFTPRQRAIFKLRFGGSGLSPLEKEKILPQFHSIATDKPHTLEEVAQCFGRTRERIRQIENALLEKLGVHRLNK